MPCLTLTVYQESDLVSQRFVLYRLRHLRSSNSLILLCIRCTPFVFGPTCKPLFTGVYMRIYHRGVDALQCLFLRGVGGPQLHSASSMTEITTLVGSWLPSLVTSMISPLCSAFFLLNASNTFFKSSLLMSPIFCAPLAQLSTSSCVMVILSLTKADVSGTDKFFPDREHHVRRSPQ